MTTYDRATMKTIPPAQTDRAFAKVNYWVNRDRSTHVRALLMLDLDQEGSQTGLALDGSGSMRDLFGYTVNPLFGGAKPNLVKPVAQTMCRYLAEKIDADGGTTAIYWATGVGGNFIEEIGDLTAQAASQFDFRGPQNYGTGTRLLPAIRYFVENPELSKAMNGFYVFITDGAIDDLDEVKRYCVDLAQKITNKQNNEVKFIIIGLGDDIKEKQMQELDDLETGTDVDLWDYRLASDIRTLEELFVEAVDANRIVASSGVIRSDTGRELKNYGDTGMPALLEFDVPPNGRSFTVEVGGNSVTQALP